MGKKTKDTYDYDSKEVYNHQTNEYDDEKHDDENSKITNDDDFEELYYSDIIHDLLEEYRKYDLRLTYLRVNDILYGSVYLHCIIDDDIIIELVDKIFDDLKKYNLKLTKENIYCKIGCNINKYYTNQLVSPKTFVYDTIIFI